MMALKIRQTLLQLDELRFAEGSPPGTAMKHDQSTPPVAGLVQIDTLAVLIWQDDVREALPNRRANLGEVDTKVHGRSHKCSSSYGWVNSIVLIIRRTSAGEDAQKTAQCLCSPWLLT
jgi:hypothetical protein